MQGEIISGVGGLYTVLLEDGKRLECRARGRFRHEGIVLSVGDTAVIEEDTNREGTFVITDILPRKNRLIRPPIANLTDIAVVIPSAAPTPDLFTADKLIAIAEYNGISPTVVVNKSDLAPDRSEEIVREYKAFPTFKISAASGEGCDAFAEYLKNEASRRHVRVSFAGASGAGKSTLVNRLFPSLSQETGDVSRKTERGRHTTRRVDLYRLELDGVTVEIADTPGFSMLDFTDFDFFPREALPHTFREIDCRLGECRYTKCTHTAEEGCAIIDAVKNGDIGASRHMSYTLLFRELKQKAYKSGKPIK